MTNRPAPGHHRGEEPRKHREGPEVTRNEGDASLVLLKNKYAKAKKKRMRPMLLKERKEQIRSELASDPSLAGGGGR